MAATEYGLGRGHAMSIFHLVKNDTEISQKHVGTGGVHSDASATLRLDGIARRRTT